MAPAGMLRIALLLIVSLLAGAPAAADRPAQDVKCSVVIDAVSALHAQLKNPAPGTTVCFAPGKYLDVQIGVRIDATADAPFTITAQHPGSVVLEGRTHIRIAGRHVTVRGLRVERASSANKQLVEFRLGSEACEYCRLTEMTITETDAASGDTKWVGLFGRHNRVDHCVFSGKRNHGGVLVVWRKPGIADHHLIDYNLFANTPPLGANGAEAIRVGSSVEQDSDSHTIVENNLFDSYDGEIEVISSKSGSNIFRHNTFRRSAGLLTLRHGNNATVEGNVFIADGKRYAGGIRIIGSGHRVTNNYIEGVRSDNEFRGGIVLMSFDSNPSPGQYQAVRNVVISNNTIVESEQSFVFGAGKSTMPPEQIEISGNAIIRPLGSVVRVVNALGNSKVTGNFVEGARESVTDGFRSTELKAERDARGFARPGEAGAGVNPAYPLRALTRADVGPVFYSVSVP